MAAVVALRPRIEPAPEPPPERPFLTASWRDFLMLSYEIEPRVLTPFVPRGTELNAWHGAAFLSLVGFRFCDARLFGVRIPWHQEFAEVNLRFYVRRRVDGVWRRGVVFLRELCSKRAVVAVAKWFYGERFRCIPLACRIDRDDLPTFSSDALPERTAVARPRSSAGHGAASQTTPGGGPSGAPPRRVEFTWRDRGSDFRLAADVLEAAHAPEPDSLAEFVVEHYWAYTASRRRTTEYLVTHRPWRIAAADAEFTGDAWRQYGPRLAPYLRGEPACAFWAEGSPLSVYPGVRLASA